MSDSSTGTAAGRGRSAAGRLAELRARLDRLGRGEPTTAEDVHRARRRARTQVRAATAARERLLVMHRSAAARHEAHAERLTQVGRMEAAGRARAAAARAYDAIERHQDTAPVGARSGPAAARHLDGDTGEALPSAADPDAAREILRLRDGLTALLSWAGKADLHVDESERRELWCRSIVEECGEPEWRGWIHAVCRTAASALPSVRGVAITVASGLSVEFLAASDTWAARVQELEFVVGEGPSVTAHADRRVVLVQDLETEWSAWQGFAAAGSGLGLRGICALPLRVRGTCVGSLTLYYPHCIDERAVAQDLAVAAAFADIAAAALLADLERARHSPPDDHERFIVDVAGGVLSAQLNIPLGEAEARLRAYTFSADLGALEAASWVLRSEGGVA